MSEPAPPPDRLSGWLNAVRGLTLSNVLVIALLAIIAVPVYVIYKAVSGNDELLDRLLSTYEEVDQQSGCAVRHVQERGGPELWAVSTGFAFRGFDRWSVSVVMTHEPGEELASYCEALKLIADRMLSNGQ